jgi:crossover junction endodeoxyribonuclease RusA
VISAAKGLDAWERAVRQAAQHAMVVPRVSGDALQVTLCFRMPRPACRKHDVWHATRPDVDKLIRAVLDPMSGIVYTDDALICSVIALAKYEDETMPPGVAVTVSLMREEMIDGCGAD